MNKALSRSPIRKLTLKEKDSFVSVVSAGSGSWKVSAKGHGLTGPGFMLDPDGEIVIGVRSSHLPPPHGKGVQVYSSTLVWHSAVVDGRTRVRQLAELAPRLGLDEEDLAARCGLSRSTLHRRKQANATLSPAESDFFSRYLLLLAQAKAVFEDEAAARTWLSSPQVGLGQQVPLDLALSTAGYREVEKLLTRIDESVYA
ncbi:MAG: hypothetical protein JWM35_944 [Verrucomicrobia bacterium]|nr:hypothetical protein [Verrucomicrobiota bacterium]